LLFACSSILVLAIAVSCGGGDSSKPALPPAPGGAPAAGGFDMSKATATVGGKIVFEGTAPPAQKIQMSADPYCASHSTNALTEEVVVSDGGLQNVIVYVKSGHESFGPFRAPAEPVVIDQKDCRYTPHVFTIQTGQPLDVKNSDSTLHNIHGWAEVNAPFNVGQAVKDMKNTFKLDKEEMPLPIRCDVHRWMNSFAGVFNHPFHTVSKEAGSFSLKLPAGKYEIVAWHEKFGTQTQTVEVKDNEKLDLNFTFKGA
jgi:plastocyanin